VVCFIEILVNLIEKIDLKTVFSALKNSVL